MHNDVNNLKIQGGISAAYFPFFCVEQLRTTQKTLVIVTPRDEQV